MQARLFATCVLAASVLFSGCVESHDEFTDPGLGSVSTELVDSAWLAGNMTAVDYFAGDAYQVDAYEDYVAIHAGALGGDDFGWAMIGLTVYAEPSYDELTGEYTSYGFGSLEPGTHIDTREPSDITVSAIGCSGPEHGNFAFDGPATRVVIDVEQGEQPDERLVQFTAEYEGGQTANGSFVFHPL